MVEDFIQFFLNGLSEGSELAIVTLGFALVVNTGSLWHIAHCGTFVVGAYLAWVMMDLLGMPLWLVVILTIALCGLIGSLMELWLYRPLRRVGSPIAAFLLASIGLSFITLNGTALFAGTYPKIVEGLVASYNIGEIYFTNIDIIVIAACALVFGFLYYFLNHTVIGICIKAVASNPQLATVWGADSNRISLIVMVVASFTVAPASLLRVVDIGILPFAGWDVIILSLMAYVLGGVGNTMGAGFAALAIGIIKNLITWQMPSVWAPLIIFGIVYLFMWLRPRGISGSKIWSYEV